MLEGRWIGFRTVGTAHAKRMRQPVPSWPGCEVQAVFSNSSRPISMRRISLLRDAKLYEIGAGTSEIRRMLIGRELFEKTA